ncbi:MAG: CcoQ/FixQ family Cbb3-type cytochrome c oxidase assembly chaperone [Nitrospirales bacterium]|nr:CcoQ/FixQ family Cbb3-type cytochrome c oxidase assembly chaperone [Nitrospirales bacterium]
MKISGWINVAVTIILVVTFVGIIWHYYKPKKKKKEIEEVEQPKYRMLEDEEEKPEK